MTAPAATRPAPERPLDWSEVEADARFQQLGMPGRHTALDGWAKNVESWLEATGQWNDQTRRNLEAETAMIRDRLPPTVPERAASAAGAAVQGFAGLAPDALQAAAFVGTAATGGDSVADTRLFQAGERLRAAIEEAAPVDPRVREEFWNAVVPGAVGSFGSFLLGGGLTGAATRVGARQITKKALRDTAQAAAAAERWGRRGQIGFAVTAASGSGIARSYGEALALEASEEDARLAGWLGIGPGAVQVFPVVRALERFNRASRGELERSYRRWLVEGGKGGFEEFVAESAGQIGFNAIARAIYDQDREFLEGVAEAGAAGGVAGFLASALLSAAPGRSPAARIQRAERREAERLGAEATGGEAAPAVEAETPLDRFRMEQAEREARLRERLDRSLPEAPPEPPPMPAAQRPAARREARPVDPPPEALAETAAAAVEAVGFSADQLAGLDKRLGWIQTKPAKSRADFNKMRGWLENSLLGRALEGEQLDSLARVLGKDFTALRDFRARLQQAAPRPATEAETAAAEAEAAQRAEAETARAEREAEEARQRAIPANSWRLTWPQWREESDRAGRSRAVARRLHLEAIREAEARGEIVSDLVKRPYEATLRAEEAEAETAALERRAEEGDAEAMTELERRATAEELGGETDPHFELLEVARRVKLPTPEAARAQNFRGEFAALREQFPENQAFRYFTSDQRTETQILETFRENGHHFETLDDLVQAVQARLDLGKPVYGNPEISMTRYSRRPGETPARAVTPEQDAAYLKAVERGDMETAQKMVDEAARAAGYDIRAAHGSPSRPFWVFDPLRRGERTGSNSALLGYFASSEKSVAAEYKMTQSERRRAGERGPLAFNLANAEQAVEAAEAAEAFAEFDQDEGGWIGRVKSYDQWGTEYTWDADQMVYDNQMEAVEAADTARQTEIDEAETALAEKIAEYEKSAAEMEANRTLHDLYLRLANPLIYDFEGGTFRDKSYSELVQEAIAEGRDGVIMENTVDSIDSQTPSDVYVFFQSSQAKLADPVTRDEAGNVIPLSQRFDPAQEDIRFSRRKKDYLQRQRIAPEERAAAAEYLDRVEEVLSGSWAAESDARGQQYLDFTAPEAPAAAPADPGPAPATSRARFLRDPLRGMGEPLVGLADGERVLSVYPDLVQEPFGRLDLEGKRVETPEDFALLALGIRSPYQEKVGVAVVDSANRILRAEVVTIGSMTASQVHPILFQRVIDRAGPGAAGFVIFHNHPSGNPRPSDADMDVTRHTLRAGNAAGVPLLDHIIINGDTFYSFAAAGRVGGLPGLPGMNTRERAPKVITREGAQYPIPDGPHRAPWEAVPRHELFVLNDPAHVETLAFHLSAKKTQKTWLLYANHHLGLVGVEAAPLDANPQNLGQRAIHTATAAGASHLFVIHPTWDRLTGQNNLDQIQSVVRQHGIHLVDAATSDLLSYNAAGLLEAPAAFGEARFSRSPMAEGFPGPDTRAGAAAIRRELAPVIERLEADTGLKVEIVDRQENLPGWIRRAAGDSIVDGVYAAGRVWLVAENLGTPANAAAKLAHEAVGHAGLRGVLGETFNDFMAGAADLLEADPSLAALRREVMEAEGIDPANPADRVLFAEEMIARMAEGGPVNRTVMQRLYDAVRAWLRRIGLDLRLSDADINAALARAWQITGLDRAAAEGPAAPLFARGAGREGGARFSRRPGEGQPAPEPAGGDPADVVRFDAQDLTTAQLRERIELLTRRLEEEGDSLPPAALSNLMGKRQEARTELADREAGLNEPPAPPPPEGAGPLAEVQTGAERAGIVFEPGGEIPGLLERAVTLRAFHESATDTLARVPEFRPLADAIEAQFDRRDELTGALYGNLRPALDAVARLPRRRRKEALAAFEVYMAARENGRADEAAAILEHAPPETSMLVEAWQGTARMAAQVARRIGIQVTDARGNVRAMGEAKNYWPRVRRKEVIEAMAEPTGRRAALWKELERALIEEGHVKTPEEAQPYLVSYFKEETANDFFSNIERARVKPLPEIFYDYSPKAAMGYIAKFSERASQIEKYGQKLRPEDLDLFEQASRSTTSRRTQEYIAAARRRVYSEFQHEISNEWMANLNMLAGGSMLGNPFTAMRNLFGGQLLTAQNFGVARSLRGLLDTVREFSNARVAGIERGVLKSDFLRVLHDAEHAQSRVFGLNLSDGLRRYVDFMMKFGGYTPTEQFIRMHAMVTSQAFIRDALAEVNRDPASPAALRYAKWFQTQRLDFTALLAEGGDGPATERAIRHMVKIPQGSYEIDNTPIFIDTTVGRFLFKYQKFGTQVSRFFFRDMLAPFLETVAGKNEVTYNLPDGRTVTGRTHHFLPLLRFVAVATAGGLTMQGLAHLLFGMRPSGASLEEMEKALEDDETARALALMAERSWFAFLFAGAGGIYAPWLQMGTDVYNQQRVRSPMDPPGLAAAENLGELARRFFEQDKTLTAADIRRYVLDFNSGYRRYREMGYQGMKALDAQTRNALVYDAWRERQWAQGVIGRYANETGLEGRTVVSGRIARSPQSPVNDRIYEALVLGHAAEARAIAREYLNNLESEDEIQRALRSMQSMARARQPLRVTTGGGEADRLLFLDWARRRLPESDFRRLELLDTRYRRAAIAGGFMNEREEEEIRRQLEQRDDRRRPLPPRERRRLVESALQ